MENISKMLWPVFHFLEPKASLITSLIKTLWWTQHQLTIIINICIYLTCLRYQWLCFGLKCADFLYAKKNGRQFMFWSARLRVAHLCLNSKIWHRLTHKLISPKARFGWLYHMQDNRWMQAKVQILKPRRLDFDRLGFTSVITIRMKIRYEVLRAVLVRRVEKKLHTNVTLLRRI